MKPQFKITKFPKEYLVRIHVKFPNGAEFHYNKDDSVFATWLKVLETQENLFGLSPILKDDLIRVQSFRPDDWHKGAHSNIIFITMKGEEWKNELAPLRCCKVLSKEKGVYRLQYIDGSIWNVDQFHIANAYAFAEHRKKENYYQPEGFPQTYNDLSVYFRDAFKQCYPEGYREDPPKP